MMRKRTQPFIIAALPQREVAYDLNGQQQHCKTFAHDFKTEFVDEENIRHIYKG